MRKFANVPTNPNTLFLRNLETILIFKEICNSRQIANFRLEIAPHILDILEKYKYACEDNTHEGLQNRYISNCISVREHIDHLSKTTYTVQY